MSGIFRILRMLQAGLIRLIPGNPQTCIDIVPVDVVVTRVLDCVRAPGRESLLWVTSGAEAPTLERLMEVALSVMRRNGQPDLEEPRFVSPAAYRRVYRPFLWREFSGAQRLLLAAVEELLPYFEVNHRFPTTAGVNEEDLIRAWQRSVEYFMQVRGPLPHRTQPALRPRTRTYAVDADRHSPTDAEH